MARSRRRQRNRKGRRRQQSHLPNGIIIAGLATVVTGLAYIYYVSPTEVRRDPVTLCPESAADIPHHEVLLFERNRRTEYGTNKFVPLSKNTALQIRRKIQQGLNEIPKNSLVEIYEVNYSTQEEFKPYARFCNPGDGSDISEFTGNPRLAKQRYDKLFRAPFDEIVESLSSWNPDHRYSLIDSLGGVSRLVLGNEELEHTTKALTVVSDFIVPENFTSGKNVVQGFKEINTSSTLGDFDAYVDAGGLRFDFHASSVRMIINREKYVLIPDIQGPEHVTWWERFFDAQNATVEGVENVGEW